MVGVGVGEGGDADEALVLGRDLELNSGKLDEDARMEDTVGTLRRM